MIVSANGSDDDNNDDSNDDDEVASWIWKRVAAPILGRLRPARDGIRD